MKDSEIERMKTIALAVKVNQEAIIKIHKIFTDLQSQIDELKRNNIDEDLL